MRRGSPEYGWNEERDQGSQETVRPLWIPDQRLVVPEHLTIQKVELPRYREYLTKELLPVAALTRRFIDFARERFAYLGGTLEEHLVDLARRTRIRGYHENVLRHASGAELLDIDLAVFIALFEDMDEIDRDNPHPDRATNGKSLNHREEALMQFQTNLRRVPDEELRSALTRFIEPLVRRDPLSTQFPEARFVKAVDAEQLVLEDSVLPKVDLDSGIILVDHQRELAFDVAFHRTKILLDALREFPSLGEHLRGYVPTLELLVEDLRLLDRDQVSQYCQTLCAINPDRRYADAEEIAITFESVYDRLQELRTGPRDLTQDLPENRLVSIRRAS